MQTHRIELLLADYTLDLTACFLLIYFMSVICYFLIQSTPASSSKMAVVNLKDLVESASHKWYKDNEKDSTKAKWGKTYNWKELVKEIDWRSLKLVIQVFL